ncbi:hypothetical protein MMAD_32620 [Mycolicibacterium madagascariense]|uniref:Uncharacterized protein n=1 Tax=Mycolicibacterium madagascariense TaxID=212765 RepID=A0A7I7XIE0_9MYCO|nr:hypothetical protein MMAD_32620 [Mycolicibacterium madagascariense]
MFTGAMASGAMATGLLIALGVGTAHADVLDDIDKQYDTGAGGGQISNLIHTAIKLRGQGFRPSVGNVDDLEAAMTKRPNQIPLIQALQQTVQYQKQNQSRSSGGGGPALNPPTIGIGGGNPGSYPPDPNGGGGINIPLG